MDALDAAFPSMRMNWDAYDAELDRRSEDRYADERGEPTTDEVREATFYPCSVDESAGMRDTLDGGK